MQKSINKTFICESTYFNCEQVVRTEIHLMKMYKLCKKVQNFEIEKRGIEYKVNYPNYTFSRSWLKAASDLSNIGMKIKVVDNERIF